MSQAEPLSGSMQDGGSVSDGPINLEANTHSEPHVATIDELEDRLDQQQLQLDRMRMDIDALRGTFPVVSQEENVQDASSTSATERVRAVFRRSGGVELPDSNISDRHGSHAGSRTSRNREVFSESSSPPDDAADDPLAATHRVVGTYELRAIPHELQNLYPTPADCYYNFPSLYYNLLTLQRYLDTPWRIPREQVLW